MWTEAEVVERQVTERGELVLQKRGDDFEIISNGTFLMATYNGESERRLVRAALHVVKKPHSVLIGGLGVGFSLQEALQDDRVRTVDVFEIEPAIVQWNQAHLGEEAQQAIADERTRVLQGDLVEWVHGVSSPHVVQAQEEHGAGATEAIEAIEAGQARHERGYDAVCLDIDNGSDWTVHDDNASLYSHQGMQRLGELLSPGGALTFWNARRDHAFEDRLSKHFASVDFVTVEHPVGEPDVVYLVREPLDAFSARRPEAIS